MKADQTALAEKHNGHKLPEPAPMPEPAQEFAPPVAALSGPLGAAGDGTPASRATRLGDPRLHAIQRQALATQIGQVQGNQHLQRVVQRQGAENAGAAALIVEDEAPNLQPGQTPKSEFLAQLKEAVCAAADEALAGSPFSALGCPYIANIFSRLPSRPATYIERGIRLYAPEAAGATTATGYLLPITNRVRMGIAHWRETGEVAGVPANLASLAEDAPAEAAVGGAPQRGPIAAKSQMGHGPAISEPDSIRARLGAGRPLEGEVRSRMEPAFAEDFSRVRVHTDSRAAGLSSELNARAFAVGGDVAFGSGEYRPGTPVGDALIAHELAHVVQQRGLTASPQPWRQDGGPDHPLEDEADKSAVGVTASLWGRAVGGLGMVTQDMLPRLKSGLRLQRCKGPKDKLEEYGLDEANPYGLTLVPNPAFGDKAFVGMKVYYTFTQTEDKIGSAGGFKTYVNKLWTHSPGDELTEYRRDKPVKFTQPGTWVVGAEIRVSREVKIRIGTVVEVVSLDEFGEDKLREQLENEKGPGGRQIDYVSFRAGLKKRELELAQGGVKDQKFGPGPYITSDGPNPAEPKGKTGLGRLPSWDRQRYTIHPGPKAAKFRWYVRCQNWARMADDFYGYHKTRIDGEEAYELNSTAATASWIMAEPNVYTIVCQELDEDGRALGTPAMYRQVIQSAEQLEQVEAWRGYMGKVEQEIAKIQDGKDVPIRAVYASQEGGQTQTLALFIGQAADDAQRLKLVDLTPGVSPREYEGATTAETLSDFEKRNKYPDGVIRLDIPANQAGVEPQQQTIKTEEKETGWAKWSRRAGWASLGLTALGFLALVVPGGQVVAPYLFTGAALTGGASSGMSLVDRLEQTEVSGIGVAVDIVGIAASLLALTGSVKSLTVIKRGSGVSHTGRFVRVGQGAATVTEGALIAYEYADEIDRINNDPTLTRSQKADAMVRLVTLIGLNLGLMAHGARDVVADARARLGGHLEQIDIGTVPAGDLEALNGLDDRALQGLAQASTDDLTVIGKLAREDAGRLNRLASQHGDDLLEAIRKGAPTSLDELEGVLTRRQAQGGKGKAGAKTPSKPQKAKTPAEKDETPAGDKAKTRGEAEEQLTDVGRSKPVSLTREEQARIQDWALVRNRYLKKWREMDLTGCSDETKRLVKRADNAIRDHLTPDDLAGALKERRGVVIEKGDGKVYDHTDEVTGAMTSMKNHSRSIQQRLSNLYRADQHASRDVAVLTEKLSDLSALLDDVRKAVE